MAGCVLPPLLATGRNAVEAVEEARSLAGGFVALDNPEYQFACLGKGREDAAALVDALRVGLQLVHLRAVVNLNCALPPPSIDDLAAGPLFPGHPQGDGEP
jgi:hypothetical protein